MPQSGGEGVADACAVELYGEEHLEDAFCGGEEVFGLVEDAVSEACSYDYAAEAVEEEGLEFLFAVFLLYVEFADAEVCAEESDDPAEGVPSDGDGTEVEGREVWIPVDEEWHGVGGLVVWLFSCLVV